MRAQWEIRMTRGSVPFTSAPQFATASTERAPIKGINNSCIAKCTHRSQWGGTPRWQRVVQQQRDECATRRAISKAEPPTRAIAAAPKPPIRTKRKRKGVTASNSDKTCIIVAGDGPTSDAREYAHVDRSGRAALAEGVDAASKKRAII